MLNNILLFCQNNNLNVQENLKYILLCKIVSNEESNLHVANDTLGPIKLPNKGQNMQKIIPYCVIHAVEIW
jgi:hypothetical protein